jgi:hypothetical protein
MLQMFFKSGSIAITAQTIVIIHINWTKMALLQMSVQVEQVEKTLTPQDFCRRIKVRTIIILLHQSLDAAVVIRF